MSRIRSTLNTVTKAVSGSDLLSKISRLKPSAAAAHAEKVLEPLTPSPTPAASDPSAAAIDMKPPEQDQTVGQDQNNGEEGKENQPLQALEKPFMAIVKPKQSLAASVAISTASSSSAIAKQTLQLFQPEALSTNMDETYSSLSQHVNDYFGSCSSLSTGDDKKPHHLNDNAQASTSSKPALSLRYQSTKSGDHIPVSVPVAAETKAIQGKAATPQLTPPLEEVSPATDSTSSDPVSYTSTPTPTLTPSKKGGFGQYLSDPRPNVQAFFGSYIAPLVPSKFRADPKSVTAAVEEKTTEEAMRKPGEKMETEEQKKNAEEGAKKLLLTQIGRAHV